MMILLVHLASRVAWTLEYLGHNDVSLLDMTFGKWNSLGLETDSKIPSIESKNPFSTFKT